MHCSVNSMHGNIAVYVSAFLFHFVVIGSWLTTQAFKQ